MVEMRARVRAKVLPALRTALNKLKPLHGKIAVDSRMKTANDIDVESTIRILEAAIEEVGDR